MIIYTGRTTMRKLSEILFDVAILACTLALVFYMATEGTL